MKTLELDFKQYSKKEWLELIARSLKKGSIEDFVWSIDEGVNGEPFAHADDLSKNYSPVKNKVNNNRWLSGIDYSLVSNDSLNECIKLHSGYGLQSIILQVTNSDIDLSTYFGGINILEYDINFNTSYGVDLIFFLEHVKDYLEASNLDYKKLNLTIRLPVNRPQLILELYKYSKVNFPHLKLYYKTEREYSYNPVKYLSETLNILSDYIKKSEIDREILEWLLSKLKIHFFMTDNFLSNIASLRAFKILWNNYLSAYRIKSFPPDIMLGINHDSFTEDENDDLIVTTILCMSGAISGVGSINLAPKEHNITDPQNTMRLMLNIQNIMKLESNMDVVEDAMAGSYAIETATNKLASAAWDKLH